MSTLLRLKKLRKMSAGEIRDRMRQCVQVRRERKLYLANSDRCKPVAIDAAIAEHLLENTSKLLPGCDGRLLDSLRERSPHFVSQISAAATDRGNRVLRGSVSLLGRTAQVGVDVDWSTDQQSGYSFPRGFYSDVSIYELPDAVDVKHVWELNRHQYFVDLARGWRLTDREEFAIRLRELILGWIDENPLYEGVNWTSALEVGVRAISWIWSLAMCSTWSGWTGDDRRLIAGSMAQHATYLHEHFSYYSSPYNHLIGEATGLYLLSHALSDHPTAPTWCAHAKSALEEHGPRQFYADGFSVEQGVGYHYFSLGFLAMAVAAGRVAAEPLENLEVTLPKAFRAGAMFMQPDGTWPAIGDVDSARSIPLAVEDFWDFRSLNALGAVLFDTPELMQPPCELTEEVLWLCGDGAFAKFDSLESKSLPTAGFLDASGYAIARGKDQRQGDWLLFDAGPLGDGVYEDATASVSHGHADALSLLLYLDSNPLLVDSGTSSYAGSRQWVDYARGESAHNTIAVDGLPKAEQPSRLAWSRVHRRPKLDANLDADVWLARGMLELGETAVLSRSILGIAGHGIWIADLVDLDRARGIHWYWHFVTLPQLQTDDCRDCSIAYSIGNTQFMTYHDGASLSSKSCRADQSDPVGWLSPGYGQRQPGCRLTISSEPVKNALVVTYIGSTPTPFEVCVAEHRLSAGQMTESPLHDSENAPSAEILWKVEIEGRVESIAAGLQAPTLPDGWHSIRGVGSWPGATTMATTKSDDSLTEAHYERVTTG